MDIITCVAVVSNKRDRLETPAPACYSGSVTDPNLEKLVDRSYTRRRSRLVDLHLIWRDLEGVTSGKGVRL